MAGTTTKIVCQTSQQRWITFHAARVGMEAYCDYMRILWGLKAAVNEAGYSEQVAIDLMGAQPQQTKPVERRSDCPFRW